MKALDQDRFDIIVGVRNECPCAMRSHTFKRDLYGERESKNKIYLCHRIGQPRIRRAKQREEIVGVIVKVELVRRILEDQEMRGG